MNIMIIGYGSIGQRHAELFQSLGCRVGIVSNRVVGEGGVRYRHIRSALSDNDWDLALIANRTMEHYLTLNELVKSHYTGNVLVEKPIFESPREVKNYPLEKIFVSYNLRFHPCIQRLRALLKGEIPISAQFYVGQYLPGWRPGQDYRKSYSASKEMGGGALRDLSHELDLMLWLFGRWKWVAANGGTFSELELTSDDVFALLVETEHCPIVTVQLNYLDRVTQRKIIVNTQNHTYVVDLVGGTIRIDGDEERYETNRNTTYLVQHERIMKNNFEQICTYAEGMALMKLIEAAENYASRKAWMKNEFVHDMR